MLYPLQAKLHILNVYDHTILPHAMQRPELFAAFLAEFFCYHSFITSGLGVNRFLKETMFYRSLAISNLKKRLASAQSFADDEIIMTTLYLMSSDVGKTSFSKSASTLPK